MNAREIFERRLRQAVKASAREVQTAAQNNHKFTSRTGQLERAIDVRMIGDKTAEVYIDSQAAYYGPFVHEGTQPHDIFPKRKRPCVGFLLVAMGLRSLNVYIIEEQRPTRSYTRH